MQSSRTFRLPAVCCALALLLSELVSRPYAEMGICDDWSYIRTAQRLALTGHLFYNGWATAMLGWQLYLGAAFIKLFGFSFTTVRMSTLLVAMLTAFLLQRTFVRAGLREHNATIATLALVLSPLFMMLSVTFMTDIQGLFAIILCLYGCLRAMQAATERSTIAWLCFAVVTNTLCGTSRQIAWLGVLMVLSTLWLLRARRRVLLIGTAATLAGMLTIACIMHWFHQQPYVLGDAAFSRTLPWKYVLLQVVGILMDLPLLVLPVLAAFIRRFRVRDRKLFAALFCLIVAYMLYAVLYWYVGMPHWRVRVPPVLDPALGDWISKWGIFQGMSLKGTPPTFLQPNVQLLITFASLCGLLCLAASLRQGRTPSSEVADIHAPSARQIAVVLVPFIAIYGLLLLSRAGYSIFDRYMLVPMFVAVLFMVRHYQSRIRSQLPAAVPIMVGIFALYGIVTVHNNFAIYRARVEINAELHTAGVPNISIDGGWEQNMWTELQYSDYVNDPRILFPAHAYIAQSHSWACKGPFVEDVPVVKPLYAISFDPDACYGPSSFAPEHYSRWLASQPGTLYIVRAIPPDQ